MMPALLVAAMLTGAVSVVAAMAMSAPLWVALLAYPAAGSALILAVVVARLAFARSPAPKHELAMVPSRAGSSCAGH